MAQLLNIWTKPAKGEQMVSHDINLAVRYADNLIAMRDGKIKTSGEPHNVVTVQMMHDVFSIQAQILKDPVSGSPLCIPMIEIHKLNQP